MEDKDITFSIAVPLYLAKVVVGRPHPFVGLRNFRPLAAWWERLQ